MAVVSVIFHVRSTVHSSNLGHLLSSEKKNCKPLKKEICMNTFTYLLTYYRPTFYLLVPSTDLPKLLISQKRNISFFYVLRTKESSRGKRPQPIVTNRFSGEDWWTHALWTSDNFLGGRSSSRNANVCVSVCVQFEIWGCMRVPKGSGSF